MPFNFTAYLIQQWRRAMPHHAFRFLTALMFVCFVAASSAHATTTYSDSWLDDSNTSGGFVVGCGLTESNYGDDWELHQVRATTTIRSPDGRTATRTGIRHYDWSQGSTFTVRAEPLLAWDWNDTGDYIISTRHYSTCPATELGNSADIIRVGFSNAVYVAVQSQPDGCLYRITENCNTTCKTTEIKITNPAVCQNYMNRKTPFQETLGFKICSVVGVRVDFSSTEGLCFDLDVGTGDIVSNKGDPPPALRRKTTSSGFKAKAVR